MGSDKSKDSLADEDETWPFSATGQGTVDLPAFYMGRYEVTEAQFKAFVDADKDKVIDQAYQKGNPNRPVSDVSWRDALAYAQWLDTTLREMGSIEIRKPLSAGWHVTLPSEAEWEKAARGTDGRIYPWGNKPDPSRANYNSGSTKPVGSYQCPECPYPLADMSGNVYEWTRSLFEPYPYDATDGREDLKAGTPRVVRGSSCCSAVRLVRAASRRENSPVNRHYSIGFRVVVSRF